jgi:hypothetical protein
MLLPHAQHMRAVARLLALESAVNAHRGRPHEAVDSIVGMFTAARSLEQEPILISQLVRMAIGSMARRRLAWLLSAVTLDDSQLARLDAELSATDYQHSLHRAMLGERAMGIQVFANPASLRPDVPNAGLGLSPASDEAVYLQFMEEMIVAADKTGPARKEAVDRAEARLKQLAGKTTARLRYPLTLTLVPALRASADAASRNEAERDATRVAVAIERFRRSQGRLPQKLDELVPKFLGALPIDPFSGASLHYRVDAAEYVVYSVGIDGVDDGGASDPPGQPADIVVRVRN